MTVPDWSNLVESKMRRKGMVLVKRALFPDAAEFSFVQLPFGYVDVCFSSIDSDFYLLESVFNLRFYSLNFIVDGFFSL